MYLTELSIKRPVVATVFSLILVTFGLFVFSKLPVRELPSGLQPPVVQIQVDYQGANAEFLLNHTDLSELHLVDTWALKSFQEMLDNKGDFQVGMPMKISVVNKMKEQLMLLCKEYRGEDNPSVAFEFVYKSVLEKFKESELAKKIDKAFPDAQLINIEDNRND